MANGQPDLRVLLDDFAGGILILDPKDLPEIARLHTLLETLGETGRELGLAAIEQEARQLAKLLERMIRDEDPDPLETLKEFGHAVTRMQRVMSPGAMVPPKAPSPAQAAPITASAPAAPSPVPSSAATIEVDESLISDFVNEAREHLEAANINLLSLETDPGLADAIDAIFRAFHTIKGVAGFLGFSSIQALAHEAENILDQARKGRLRLGGPSIDVLFDATDALKALVDNVENAPGEPIAENASLEQVIERLRGLLEGDASAPDPSTVDADRDEVTQKPENPQRLGELLVQSGKISAQEVEAALASQEAAEEHMRLGEVLVRQQRVAPREVAQALRVQKQTENPAGAKVREIVKVDAERLDRLVDMIGELVIAESMVSQADELRAAGSSRLNAHLKELDKITRELQEMGMGLRMIPLRSTFQKMARLVRDLALKSGKKVSFSVIGEDTELDKMVVDKIGDPLVHMIRNAVDHGLESESDERRRAGKPEAGRVELRAFHRGGSIFIEIEDDGRGLDREAILAKARERGLVAADAQLSDRDVFNLIFHAGLSTAKKVSDVSGRGVGMDVVRRNIEALRGQIEIQSEPGVGSVFTIRLPLTLAIIDGMVLRVGRERYVVPTLAIHTSLRPAEGMVSQVQARGRMLRLKEELIPIFKLDRLFGVRKANGQTQDELVVVVEHEGMKVGLAADELLGQQQIVIKPLGDALRETPGVSGGAIMPDGQISLILDVAGLIKLAHGNTYAHSA